MRNHKPRTVATQLKGRRRYATGAVVAAASKARYAAQDALNAAYYGETDLCDDDFGQRSPGQIGVSSHYLDCIDEARQALAARLPAELTFIRPLPNRRQRREAKEQSMENKQ